MIIKTIKKIGLQCMLYKMISRIIPNDKNVTAACDRIGAYKYLKRYEYALDKNTDYVCDQKEFKQRIWICWLQGYENAPDIVKRCKESVLRYSSGCDVVVLDNDNIKEYIEVPDFIEEKHNKGIIHHTQYSDYIRVALLSKYGGIWIDSTALLTSPLPEYILKADLFCFKLPVEGRICASSWFISAKPNHPILNQMLSIFNEYWMNENKLVSYSMIHLCWYMVVNHNEHNKMMWEDVPYIDDVNCKLLQMDLFKKYSEERYQQIINLSSVHKLTYKFPEECKSIEGTFYCKLLGR